MSIIIIDLTLEDESMEELAQIVPLQTPIHPSVVRVHPRESNKTENQRKQPEILRHTLSNLKNQKPKTSAFRVKPKKPKHVLPQELRRRPKQRDTKASRLVKLSKKTEFYLSLVMKKTANESPTQHNKRIAHEAKLFMEMCGEGLVKKTRMTKTMAMSCFDHQFDINKD